MSTTQDIARETHFDEMARLPFEKSEVQILSPRQARVREIPKWVSEHPRKGGLAGLGR